MTDDVPTLSPPSPKPWTLLAYTVADDKGESSPLDKAAEAEVKAICQAADLSQMHIAVQLDRKKTRGVFRAVLRARTRKDFEDVEPEKYLLWREVAQQVEQSDLSLQREAKALNSASGGTLREFLAYGREQCPAKRYVIFFYGHAFGPMGLFYDQAARERRPSTLRLTALASALHTEDGSAEVILFRDCFLDTLETACQLRGVAKYMIATQAEAPIAGQWPWSSILSSLMESAQSSEVAGALALQLAAHFRSKENRGRLADVPCSLIDIEAAQEVVAPLGALADALDAVRGDAVRCAICIDALEAARLGAPNTPNRPGDAALLDVPTLCENLQALGEDPIAAHARSLRDVVLNRVVKAHHSQQRRFRGISIYYKPFRKKDLDRSFIQAVEVEDVKADDAYYESLALNQATRWHRVALKPLGS